MSEQKSKPYCYFSECDKDADYDILPQEPGKEPYDGTQSCALHISELMYDGRNHVVTTGWDRPV